MSTALVVRDPKSQSLLARLKSSGMKFPGRRNRRRRRRGGRGRGGGQRNGRRQAGGRGPLRGSGQLVEVKSNGIRDTRSFGAPTSFGSIRNMSSNPKIYGGLMSQGSVFDPEWGVGERCQIASYITDVATNGDGTIGADLPFLVIGGGITSHAYSGFGVGGTNFSGIDLSPEYFFGSRLGTYATLYNRYRWRSLTSSFNTGSQTNVVGQFAQGISSDPIVFPEANAQFIPNPSYQAINNHNSTVTGSTWQNFDTKYRYDGKRAWYTRDPQDLPGQPTIGGEDTAADLRSVIQCRLMGLLKFITTTVLRSYGYVELAGVIEFFDPVNTTATAGVTPIDVTPFNEKKHMMLKHPSGIPTIVKRGRVIPVGDNRPPLYNPKVFNPKKPGVYLKHRVAEELKLPRVDEDVKSTHSEESESFVLRDYVPKAVVRPVVPRKPPTFSSESSTPQSWEEAALETVRL